MDFLISSAVAQAAGPGQGAAWQQLLIFVPVFVLFYFMLIRPQTKKAKEHRDMISKVAVGDEVVTAGGILGKITEAGESFLTVEISNNVTVKVQRFQVTQLMPKGTLKSA